MALECYVSLVIQKMTTFACKRLKCRRLFLNHLQLVLILMKPKSIVELHLKLSSGEKLARLKLSGRDTRARCIGHAKQGEAIPSRNQKSCKLVCLSPKLGNTCSVVVLRLHFYFASLRFLLF